LKLQQNFDQKLLFQNSQTAQIAQTKQQPKLKMEIKGKFYFDICGKFLKNLKPSSKTHGPKICLLNPSIPNESSSLSPNSSAIKNLAPVNFANGARQSNR